MSLRTTIMSRLKEAFPEAEIELAGENDRWQIEIGSDVFVGLNKVKQHQAVYKPLNDLIASNQVHALNVACFTMEQWNNR